MLAGWKILGTQILIIDLWEWEDLDDHYKETLEEYSHEA
jgi:hypothetical protein